MPLVVAKIVSMVGLGLVTWILGIFPIIGVRRGWLNKSAENRTAMILSSLLFCFGGGVILTSCLTHMLPDVNESLLNALAKESFPKSGLPVAEILILAGFLMIYILEELMHFFLERHHDHDHDNKDNTNTTTTTSDLETDGEKAEKSDQGHGHSHANNNNSDKQGHGHSHNIMPTEDTFQAAARGFMLILALCIHDLFEGIAIGVIKRETSVWFLLLAFASHKWVIGACLGLGWARSALRPLVSVIYMSAFCVVSPIGILIGMLITDPDQESDSPVVIVLQGIATGSLLYVVFFEILEKERQKAVPGILQALGFAAGYIFMVLLGLAETQSEAGDEHEGNSTLTSTLNSTLNATELFS